MPGTEVTPPRQGGVGVALGDKAGGRASPADPALALAVQ